MDGERFAIAAAGPNKARNGKRLWLRAKHKNALSPSRPVHALLGWVFLIYGVILGVIARVGIGVKGLVSTGAR